MGNIGTERREVEFEPLTEPQQPVRAPQPEPPRKPAPAYDPSEVPAGS